MRQRAFLSQIFQNCLNFFGFTVGNDQHYVQPVTWGERVKAVQPSQYPRGSESSCNRKMHRVKMRCGFCFSFGVVATMSHCATQAEML